MPVICPDCGYDENPKGAEFCEACGLELSQKKVTTPSPSPLSEEEEINPQPPPLDLSLTSPTQQKYSICPHCGYDKNPESVEFCESCGSELSTPDLTSPSPTPTVEEPSPTFSTSTVIEEPSPTVATTAKLIAKQPGAPVPEFLLDSENFIIGRFDPDTGPVDIDLEGFLGDDTISRNHAEIYREGNQWKIQDLGSVNGVFIKRSNQRRFNARLTFPEVLYPGDEVAIAKIRFIFQTD